MCLPWTEGAWDQRLLQNVFKERDLGSEIWWEGARGQGWELLP